MTRKRFEKVKALIVACMVAFGLTLVQGTMALCLGKTSEVQIWGIPWEVFQVGESIIFLILLSIYLVCFCQDKHAR